MEKSDPVQLAPLSAARLEAWLVPSLRGRFGLVSPFFAAAPATLRADFARDGLLAPARSVLEATVDGAVALVEIFASDGGAVGTVALHVAVALVDDDADVYPRQLLAVLDAARRHVFETTTALRVDTFVLAEDATARRACARAGFRFEGVLRSAGVRAGRAVDLACFGATRPSRALTTASTSVAVPHTIRRIAVLTGGGDAPGLNAVIRAVVKGAVLHHGWSVLGIEDGFEGLLGTPRTVELTPNHVRGLLPRGGTILGTTNRGSFGRARTTDQSGDYSSALASAIENLRALDVDALVTIGGDGTQTIAADFAARGVRTIGIPKTIDNDLVGTDTTFGFDSAVAEATDACDRLHTTAESHDRVMVLEVMGRNTGWIALAAGIGGGADCILIPEIPYDIDRVARAIERRDRAGHLFSIVVVAEGAAPIGGHASYAEASGAGRAARFGGVGDAVARALGPLLDKDVRVVVLGRLQRGGSPSARDRLLATTFGVEAVAALAAGETGRVLAVSGTSIVTIPFEEVAGRVKTVPPDSPLVDTARALGIELGADLGPER